MAKQDQMVINYKQCFSSEYGKRVLEDLRNNVGFDLYSLPKIGTDGHVDPLMEMFKQGQRRVIARILHLMNCDPNEEKGISNEPNPKTP